MNRHRSSETKIAAIVVAAGLGTRMKSKTRKPLLILYGKPVLQYSIDMLRGIKEISQIILVLHPKDIAPFRLRYPRLAKACVLVAGGRKRQDSVFNGVKAISSTCTHVLIHDAARPFAQSDLVYRGLAALSKNSSLGGVIPACPILGTLKKADTTQKIVATLPRIGLWEAQTPQLFHINVYRTAITRIQSQKREITDDAQALEGAGIPVGIIAGERRNLKITTPEDMALAKVFFQLF